MAATSDNKEDKILEKTSNISPVDKENDLEMDMKKESGLTETQEKPNETNKTDDKKQESQSDIDQSDDEHLMVIETPERLTILENSSCGCGHDHRHDDIELPVENDLEMDMKKESGLTETQEKPNETNKTDDKKQESQSDIDQSDDEHLMVIETPERLTILENSSCGCGHDHRHDDIELPVDDGNAPTDDLSDLALDASTPEEMIEKLINMRQHEVSDLPETVTKLVTPAGCTVYLIGTAHFSKESQEDVVKTIQTVKPDVVVVELCKSRIDILKYDEEFLLREAKNIDMQKLKFAIKQSGVVGGVMQVLLLSMSAHITKQLGMAPGGEFRVAYNEAKKIPGCQIHLGDRPIQVTLSRAMSALSLWQKTKLAWHLLTSKQPISKEDVERCKQKDLLAEMLVEMTGDFPLLYKVFVSERDQYLAKSLRLSAMPIAVCNQDGGYQGTIPSVVVGVVGIGHTEGIKENFDKDIDIQELLKVPKASKTSQLIKFSIKTLFGVFLAWGTYKLFKWTTLTEYIYIPWYN